MKTVRITLALAIALSIAVPLMAQEKKTAKAKAAKISPIARVMLRMGKIRSAIEGLDLTAEQKEKLGKSREQLGPKVGSVFGKLRDILTEEQRTASEEAGKKAREAGKEGRALIVAIEASVKITEEQQEKIDKVAKELGALNREMTRSIMGILTPEQKEKLKKALAPQPRKQGDKKDKPDEKK
ncbi:MAG: hypothetical protein V3R99_05115 [Thermoguttaceae bacterium]